MSNTRQIAKLVKAPKLTKHIIDLITKLCFREDDDIRNKSQVVFVYGTCISLDLAAKVTLAALSNSKAEMLILSGGKPTYSDSVATDKSEAEILYKIIKKQISPQIKVILETTSNNCLENVTFSLNYFPLKVSSITFITKNFAAGRNYLTLRKFFPQTTIYQQSFEPYYPADKQIITKDNWYKNEQIRNRVWAEYLRIKTYGSRGDIAYNEVKELVADITNQINN